MHAARREGPSVRLFRAGHSCYRCRVRPPRLALAALALLSMLTTACEAPEPDTPTATIATNTDRTSPPPPSPSPDPSPSPSPEDFTIPEVIDEAYVQRVLQTLYSLESEAVRQMVTAGQVTEEAEGVLRAINRPSRIEQQLAGYRELAEQGFPGVLDDPGDQRITISAVLSADSECIFAAGERDFSEVAESPEFDATDVAFFQLLPRDATSDVHAVNPTPWMLAGGEIRSDGATPEIPCST